MVVAIFAPSVELLLCARGHLRHFACIFWIVWLVPLPVAVNYGLQRRLHIALCQDLPAELFRFKKFMRFYLIPRLISQALCGIKPQQSVDQVLQLLAGAWVFPLAIILCYSYNALDLQTIFDLRACEWRRVVGYFISKDPQRPQVYFLAVSLPQHDLRCIVKSSSRHSFGQFIIMKLLGEAEVSELGISIIENQHILWLQITIYDSLRVQVLQAKHNAAQQKPHCLFAEALEALQPGGLFIDEGEDVATTRPLHHQIEKLGITEGVMEGGDEEAMRLLQYLFLQLDVGRQFFPEDLIFWNAFDCILFDLAFRLDADELTEKNLSEASASNSVCYFEIRPFQRFFIIRQRKFFLQMLNHMLLMGLT